MSDYVDFCIFRKRGGRGFGGCWGAAKTSVIEASAAMVELARAAKAMVEFLATPSRNFLDFLIGGR